MRLRSPFLATVLAAALPAVAHAQAADVIRGRVTGPDSLPLAGVTVTVTSINGGVSRTARTAKDGRFTVTFPGGEGDYMVSFAALGYAARRFEVKRTADQEILVADARLARVANVLDAVDVLAPRGRVAREAVPAPDIGGSEQAISPAAVPIDQLGDLAAMAASLPGVQLVPGQDGNPNGFSVLGLGADQNQTTLNGMNYGGGGLPRDAMIGSSMATSPYDVSRGGFSGGQFSLGTRPGSNYVTRGSSLNLDAPALQWTDRAARALGQEYTSASLGGISAGPITLDKAFYSLAWELRRRASPFQHLLNTGPTGLAAAGIASDSAARLAALLADRGVPTGTPAIGESRLGDMGSLFGSVDVAPPGSARGHAFNMTFGGSWSRQRPATGGPTDVAAASGERTSWRGNLQGRHSGYLEPFGVGILSETSVGVGGSRTWGDPWLALPAGRVRVNSALPGGGSSVQQLGFGGNQGLAVTQATITASFLNQLSWFSRNNAHRLKLTSELRRDGFEQDVATNLLGTFTFNSLADLESDRPFAFARQRAPRRTGTGQWVGALALGDAWRKSADLQLTYGLRVDGNAFEDAPARNRALEQELGVRNDRVPNRFYLSPRAGFAWTYGEAPQVAGFEGAMRGPRAVVRGGAGLFQGMPQAQLLANALGATGLPGALQSLVCVGAAAPIPRWDQYAASPDSIPTTCADGTAGIFANGAPSVSLFAPGWRAPRSWRGNLQWNGPILGNRLRASVDAIWSRNLAQVGLYDRNFAGVPGFTLADEGNRPVYVPATAIVPQNGAIDPGAGRRTDAFARVTELRSDLEGESRQLSLRLQPVRFSTRFSWSATWVLSRVDDEVRGFGSTAADPRTIERARSGFDSRHQLVYNVGYNFLDAVRVSWFGQLRSGLPFSPLVGNDVNGDGWTNDRAFVFDPATAADPALAAGMRALLDRAPASVRECLRRQVGRVAARNSCEGPWTSTATLGITLNPVKFRMPRRATVSFQVANPLGAADLLLNGSKDLRGWGQPASPDAQLLYVRGFDAATQRWRYDVNQRFGATRPATSALRAPVTLTALVRLDVGPTREEQMLVQQLDRGRRAPGDKLPEALLRAVYANGGLMNPMPQILRQQDTLRLTGAQADSIAALNRWYSVRVDSIWAPVARHLAALPDVYDQDDAWRRYLRAREASVDLLMKVGPRVKALLDDAQRRRLPPGVASLLDPRYLASIRSGTAAYASAGMGAMGGAMAPGGAEVRGGSVTVIRSQ